MSQNHIPRTLLLGVGGHGCRVVDSVYGRVPEQFRNRLGIQVFDTDINDITKLQNVREKVTQTSRPYTIRQYLELNEGQGIEDWFPWDVDDVRRKTLTEGAAQIRAISRLAFRSSMLEASGNPFPGLHEEIQRLTRATGEPHISSLRVIIVGTIVGGTGSGMFLQLALYLRDLLKTYYGIENVLVRGAFLLPDALIKGGITLPAGQRPNIYANAYASFKELEAISNQARFQKEGHGPTEKPIELEFSPTQARKDGASAELPSELMPYDRVFLWDYEAAADGGNENIGAFENYRHQMEEAIYTQLFTPLGDKQYSIEDNQILAEIANEGRSRYCSAGIAKAEYPYSDHVHYLALRWAAESIDRGWRLIDDEFIVYSNKYTSDIKNGIYRSAGEKPNVSRYFREQFVDKAKQGNPLIMRLRNQLWTNPDDVGNDQVNAASRFVAALIAHVDACIADRADFASLVQAATLNLEEFERKDMARTAQANMEKALRGLARKADEMPGLMAFGIARTVLWQGFEEGEPTRDLFMGESDKKTSPRLLRYLFNAGVDGHDAYHPLLARWILCSIEHQITEILTLKGESNEEVGLTMICENLKKGVDGYAKAYDDLDTPQVETAEIRLNEALNGGIRELIFSSKSKAWRQEYEEQSGIQKDRIQRYVKLKARELVLREVLSAISDPEHGLLGQYKRFFDGLRDERDTLFEQVNEVFNKHDNITRANPTRIFVAASPQDKEAAWTKLAEQQGDPASEDLSPAVAKTLQLTLYERSWRELVKRERSEGMGKPFQQHVSSDLAAKLKRECPWLDMNIVEAASWSVKMKGGTEADGDGALRQLIGRLNSLARPYISPADRKPRDWFALWGMHGDVAEAIKPRNLPEVSSNLATAGFTKQEMICYRAVYGLMAQDLGKFAAPSDRSPSGGEYFRHYRQRMLDRQAGSSISPHLDKRWDSPAYLPDLNDSVAEQEKKQVDLAFVHGLALGYLKPFEEDGQKSWRYFDELGGIEDIAVGSKAVGPSLADMHDSLAQLPRITQRIQERAEERIAQTLTEKPVLAGAEADIQQHPWVKGAAQAGGPGGVLNQILSLPLSRPRDARLPGMVRERLLPCFAAQLGHYYQAAFGEKRNTDRRKHLDQLVGELLGASPLFQQGSESEKDAWRAVLRGQAGLEV